MSSISPERLAAAEQAFKDVAGGFSSPHALVNHFDLLLTALHEAQAREAALQEALGEALQEWEYYGSYQEYQMNKHRDKERIAELRALLPPTENEQQRQIVPATWTTERPAVDGWYWRRVKVNGNAEVVWVHHQSDDRVVYIPAGSSHWSYAEDYVLWSGPLLPPGSEVEDNQ